MTLRHAPPLARVALLLAAATAAVAAPTPPPTGRLAVDPSTVRPQRDRRPLQAPPPRLAVLRTASASHGPFAPSAQPSLDGSPVEYLILTSEALRPAFERLAEWKTAKGVPTVVRTLADVDARGVHGSDLAETLRLYIRDAYQYWGVRFVLLGGDTEIVPPRYVAEEFLGLTDPVTDLYYSCLDGEWNADGDGNFGESYVEESAPGDFADLVAEVFVGRIPASTLAEANTCVDKLLEYERPSTNGYQNKMLLLAEVLFPVDWSPEVPVSIDGASFTENLVANLIPPAMQTTRLYQNHTPYPGSSPLSVASSVAAIDAGHGIVVHVGHGWRYTLSVGDGSLDVSHAAAFSNGVRAGLVYMLNCTAAAYDFESFAETMLLDPQGGATHVIGAAREAFPLAAADYQYAFFRHVFALGERRLGEAMARSREEFVDNAFFNNVDRWTQLTYTLLGDPEATVRTVTPAALNLGLPPTLRVGSQSVQVTVSDAGGPVADALVCARKNGEEYRTGRTNAAGQVTLVLEPATVGPVTFTATAADRLPATVQVQATVPTRALVVTGDGLVDDGAASGIGNADGRLDAGETVSLAPALRNAGSLTVAGLSATLVSNDPGVTVLQSATTYLNVLPGQSQSPSTPFTFRVAPTVPDGSLVAFTLQLAHVSGNETRRLELVVHAARPRLVGLRIDDTLGDGDGVQEPNETVDLWYTVENLGTGTLQQGSLALAALDAGFTVQDGDATLPALAPGASGESLGSLRASQSDLATAHRGRLVLRHLQDATGAVRRLDLRPPAPPSAPRFTAAERADEVHVEWSPPADADVLGYHVYRATIPSGTFERANDDLVQPAYFRESGLASSTRFQYRVVAVDSAFVESPPGAIGDVSTNPPQVSGWPNAGNDRSSSSVGVADVDADGILDIVAGVRQIYAWNGHGVELRDADADPRTWGRFYGENEAFGSIALADLDAQPGKEIIAATWDAVQRYLVVLHADGSALAGWPRALAPAPENYRGAQVAPVIANLDHTGAPEILLAARDGRLYGWHANGTEIRDGDANPATHGVLLDTGSPFLRSAPGVADLDPARPGDEIVLGGTNGLLYVIDAQGLALPGWPRSTFGSGTPFGAIFASGFSIADLDRDGGLEIVFVDGGSRLHALHVDGSSLAGFPKEGVRSASQSIVPSPAIGDLAGDAALEIAVAGSDGLLFVFDAAGQPLLPGGFIASGAATESSPVLGDLDGDAGIEIVLGNEAGVLQAWNMDGSPVAGFPIQLRAEVRGTPTIDDVDADGDVDLVLVTWDGVARVWDLGVPWRPDRAPWSTYRGDVHRTGRHGYEVPTPVAVQDFEASAAFEEGVRLTWMASAGPGDDPQASRWRIVRAGPFQASPLGDTEHILYTGVSIGEVRGVGRLEFLDPSVEPGSWYAYVLESHTPSDASRVFGPVVVEMPASIFRLRLLGNVPNPFNPQTRVQYEVPTREGGSPVDVELTLFDAQGRFVRALVRGPHVPGRYSVHWDGRDAFGRPAATGVYLARLTAAGARTTRKLTLLR